MLEEEKKGPRMWSELFGGGNSLVDGRSNTQAVMDAVKPGAGLLNVGGGQAEAPSPMSSLLSPGGLTAPVSPYEQARQNHGDGFGFFMKSMLVAKNPALAGWLMPELSAANLAQYKNDLDLYNDQRKHILEQQFDDRQLNADIGLINNGVFDEGDAAARTRLIGRDGIGTIDRANWVLSGSQPVAKPEYQVVETNNGIVAVDKTNPNAPAIPMQDESGALRKPLPQHTIDQIGGFDRMVPRLQELDEMEQSGMSLPRSAMTTLRAYETADADGNRVLSALGLEKWMAETLSPEQRRYILAAEDAGMVVLRDESGAAISAGEILRQMNQYLIFDDLDEATFEGQRNARNRKAKSLTVGLPGYITGEKESPERYQNIKWVNDFDGKRRPPPAPTKPPLASAGNSGTTGEINLSDENMRTYLALDPADQARYLELLKLQAAGGAN